MQSSRCEPGACSRRGCWGPARRCPPARESRESREGKGQPARLPNVTIRIVTARRFLITLFTCVHAAVLPALAVLTIGIDALAAWCDPSRGTWSAATSTVPCARRRPSCGCSSRSTSRSSGDDEARPPASKLTRTGPVYSLAWQSESSTATREPPRHSKRRVSLR